MTPYILYHMPGSCSRVTLNALEEAQLEYQEHAVNLMTGAQRSAAFLAINPKGKVPVLLAGAAVLTETPVILYHLAKANPDAKLLPSEGDAELTALADLVWCAGALHPIAHRIFRPGFYSATAPDSVKAASSAQLASLAAGISKRIESGGWWYGGDWSITDVFLSWIFSVAGQSGFDLDPVLLDHTARVEARPSFQRALQREAMVMERDEIKLPQSSAIR